MLRIFLYPLLAVAIVIQLVTADNKSHCVTVEADVGKCIELPDCGIILNLVNSIKKPIPQTTIEYLRLSYCGQNGAIPKVCCPIKQDDNGDDWDNSDHMNTYLLNKNDCGISKTGRIINGTTAPMGKFPWMALLVYDSKLLPYQCGGSIITERYVLTAGHCITPELKKVRLGEHRISTELDCDWYLSERFCAPPIQEFGIEKVIRHQLYQFRKFVADIALLRLNGSIDFTTGKLSPICLPVYNNLRSINLNSKNLTVTGWGLTEVKKLSDILQEVTVMVVDNVECNTKYQSFNRRPYLNDNKMCAGTKGQDSCQGDSGGPLMYINSYNKKVRYVQYGIVSYGHISCGHELPAVYTKVSQYVEWILDNLKP